MKRVFVDEARPQEVSHAVREVIERRGGLVREHVTSRVRFTSQPELKAWLRDGYVGIYQPLGEAAVELRLALRARWPSRILWTVAFLDLIMAIAFFALNPDGTLWIAGAALGGFALLAATLVQLNTLQAVREEEAGWLGAFQEELHRELPDILLEDEAGHALREAETALEGEIAQRRVDRARRNTPKAPKPTKAPKASRKLFALGPRAKAPPAPPEESAEDRLARLRARKAELEAQQHEKES